MNQYPVDVEDPPDPQPSPTMTTIPKSFGTEMWNTPTAILSPRQFPSHPSNDHIDDDNSDKFRRYIVKKRQYFIMFLSFTIVILSFLMLFLPNTDKDLKLVNVALISTVFGSYATLIKNENVKA